MTDQVDLREFVGGFVAEAEELIGAANAALLEIEDANAKGAAHPRAIQDLLRALHTIKGLAGMIGVEPIVEIAHALETLIRAARTGGTLRRGGVEVSLRALAAIDEGVRAVAEQRAQPPIPASLLEAIAATDVSSEAPMAPPPITAAWDDRLAPDERRQLFQALREGGHAYALTYRPSADLAAREITIATVRARLSELGEIVKVVPRAVTEPVRGVEFDLLLLSEQSAAVLAEAAQIDPEDVTAIALPQAEPPPQLVEPEYRGVTPFGRALVRVELVRLDDLQEQLSQLIVSRFRLEREIIAQAERGADVRRLREIADMQGRQLRELRRAILRARLVRVSEVLEPLTLLVRSLARPGTKEVRLELDARDAELDKTVADRLLPAIVHLVRNAVDHAIESVDERNERGKPTIGTLRITSRAAAGGLLELVIADDGRGIDRAEVGRRAGRTIETDEQLLEVLTTPGFSTRDTATETSGRGMGMDIVRRIIVDQLGGELAVQTQLGVGTTFHIRVPVTIAIMDVFSFVCGPQTFVTQAATVDEIFELDGGGVAPPARAGVLPVALIERRGSPLPVIALAQLLAIGDGGSARKALVVRRSGEPLAFAVDRMLGRQEVVVRPIEDQLARAPGIAGATDLGDGQPTLLLDLVELGGRITQREWRT